MEPTALKYGDCQILKSEDSVKILRRHCYPEDEICLRERFVVLCLNRSNRVIGFYLAGIGGRSSTVADISQIIAAAIKSNASAIILSHNHPSGNLQPSEADKRLTRSVKEVLKYCDIELLDHVILTDLSYLSFADDCIL